MASVNLMLASPGEEDLTAGEYQMKAAFLTHFAQFVEWPSAAPAEATIAIVGDDPFGGALEYVIGAGRSNYAFVVRRLQWNDSLAGCRIAFISSSELPHLADILENARAASVLTVGEIDGFAERGGMIELFTLGNRLRFDINAGAASAARLKISPTLQKLARDVR